MFDLKPVQFPEPAHQASLQIIYQHNYGSDARVKQELCQLVGLPKRCLLKLHSQERDNVNRWHLQGVFSWRQLGIIAPEGEDAFKGDSNSSAFASQQISRSWGWAVSPSEPILYLLSESFDWAEMIYPKTSVLVLFTRCSCPCAAIPTGIA